MSRPPHPPRLYNSNYKSTITEANCWLIVPALNDDGDDDDDDDNDGVDD
jgi:hypothetical protein